MSTTEKIVAVLVVVFVISATCFLANLLILPNSPVHTAGGVDLGSHYSKHDEVFSAAVLHKLWPSVNPVPEEVKDFPAYYHKLDCLRAWAKTVTDARTRQEYVEWLDYYADKAQHDEQALRLHKPSDTDEWIADIQETQRKAGEVAKTLPKPPDPCPLSAGAFHHE